MAKYTAQVMINRPTFLTIEVEADSLASAGMLVNDLMDANLGFKHVENFPELIGESEGTYDGFEILDVEEV